MTKKKKIEDNLIVEISGEQILKAIDDAKEEIIALQEPKVTSVARLRAQKALEANVKRGKK